MIFPELPVRWWRPFLIPVIFAALGLALYSRVILFGPFLFDDAEYVVNNGVITDLLSALTLWDPRQIGYLSFALNYAVSGESPVGFHLVNVAIHIINSLIVTGLTMRLFSSFSLQPEVPLWARQSAFFAGLLFLVHPVQTQAVSYITQRFTSLSTMFYLLSVWSYLAARQQLESGAARKGPYRIMIISMLLTVAAMRTKEIAFTIPLVMLLFELLVFRGSRFGQKRFIFSAISAATLLIIPISLFAPELGIVGADAGIADITRTDKIYDLTQRSPWHYLLTQLRVIMVYIKLIFVPIGLRVVYDFPVSKDLFSLNVLFSLISLLVILGVAVYLYVRSRRPDISPDDHLLYRVCSMGIFWFFITLSVESSVLPIKDVIFEHRVYLPSAGLLISVSSLVMFYARRLTTGYASRTGMAAVMLAVVLPLSVGTFLRNEVWTDELRFWTDVVEKSPERAIGYNNRAAARARREDYRGALEDYNKTISFFPKTVDDLFKWENSDYSSYNMSKTYIGRGNVLIALGDQERAKEDFKRSREIFSMPVDVENLLKEADQHAKQGNYKQALWIYDKILESDPVNVQALNDRSNAYSYMNRFPEAIGDLTRVIGLDPGYALAYHNRGIAYAWSGKRDRALSDLGKACGLGFEPSCESIKLLP